MADRTITQLNLASAIRATQFFPAVDTSLAGDARDIRLSLLALSMAKGTILVRGNTNTEFFQCVADGTTDDRAVILQALTAAINDMPASVIFGPGDFATSGGFELRPPVQARGLHISGAGDATTLVFHKDTQLSSGQQVMFDIRPLVNSANNIPNYLRDITISDLRFYDDSPVLHAGTEESHAVIIRETVGASIRNCTAIDIGDEAFDFTHVIRGDIINNFCEGCPSVGNSGSSVSIGIGSEQIVVAGNIIHTSSTPAVAGSSDRASTFGTRSTVALSQGISVAVVTSANSAAIRDVTITGNQIHDAFYGIFFNCADTANNSPLENMTVSDNVITNCDSGFKRSGSNGVQTGTCVIGNIVEDCGSGGIDFDVTATLNVDFTLSFNVVRSCGVVGVRANGTRGSLSGNAIQDCPRAIHIFSGTNVSINGGSVDSCGADGIIDVDAENVTTCSISGVKITNSLANGSVVRGFTDVSDCQIERQLGANYAFISRALNVRGCTLNGGILPLPTNVGGSIVGNRITYGAQDGSADTRVAITLAAGNDDFVIAGNVIDTSGAVNNQHCISIASGCENTVISGNRLKAQTTPLNDNGTNTTLTGNNTN